MGDCDIIHPKRSPEEKRAVEFILEQVERYPNEVELIALGTCHEYCAGNSDRS